MTPYPLGFDIFCRVIDNFGDIGVCWRLAKQLAERSQVGPVRLWVDDMQSFARIESRIDAYAAFQAVHDVQIVHWSDHVPDVVPNQVVIEAFGCSPPAAFIDRIQANNSLWINLEYLSAEDWVESCHGLPSLQANGANKYFYFPGFTPATGGLLKEQQLATRRAAWLKSPKPRRTLLRQIGLPEQLRDRLVGGWRQAFIFCYEDAPVHALVQAFKNSKIRTVVIIPEGVLSNAKSLESDFIHIYETPFVDQDCFDQLLWSSDLNIVRGEDSLVRAIWAEKPFLWHIYPQDEQAHLTKLDAFLAKAGLPGYVASLMHAWNENDALGVQEALSRALQPEAWSTWRCDTTAFKKKLASQSSLVTRLLQFSAQKLDKG